MTETTEKKTKCAKTGSHLRIHSMGTCVQGVTLEGNPKKPEHEYFRVAFPGGDVDIVRCNNGDYWVHVRVNNHPDPHHFSDGAQPGRLTDARLDCHDKHASETDAGDFVNPTLYHLAVRIAKESKS